MQTERMQAFKTRMQILLHAHVRHIVGQSESTIDFGESMRRKAIIFVSLPSGLPPDVKRMIGTILLSELLYAVEARYHLPARQRQHFGIYVDEVQHFANSDDFNTLFTEARKYGIAATIAHQERYGQLADNKKMAGATAAAANLVCLQLSHRDADELGPVFAAPPPTETRREQELGISQAPVTDLLRRGHKHPRINAFVRQHLRPLAEERQDAREDMEGERLIRMDFLDEAALFRLDDQVAALQGRSGTTDYHRRGALSGAEQAIWGARAQTARMVQLHERARSLRGSLREFDAFFTAVMEGRLAVGDDGFSQFLIDRVRMGTQVPDNSLPILELYLSLRYGALDTPRAIPTALAQKHGLYPQALLSYRQVAERETRVARDAFRTDYIEREWRSFIATHAAPKPIAISDLPHRSFNEAVFGPIPDRVDIRAHAQHIWLPSNIYSTFLWLLAFPSLWRILSGFRHARFDGHSKTLIARGVPVAYQRYRRCRYGNPLDKLIFRVGCAFGANFFYSTIHTPACRCEDCGEYRWFVETHNGTHYLNFARTMVVWRLKSFLRRHKEGAFVILSLLDVSASAGWGIGPHMQRFPCIAGVDPVAVLRAVKQLNELMSANHSYDAFARYYNQYRPAESFGTPQEMVASYAGFRRSIRPLTIDFAARRAVRVLKHAVSSHEASFHKLLSSASALKPWNKADEFARGYLFNRTCDLVFYGEEHADRTFPQPALPKAKEIVLPVSRYYAHVRGHGGAKAAVRSVWSGSRRRRTASCCAPM